MSSLLVIIIIIIMVFIMHLSMYSQTTPLRHAWGYSGGFDTKSFPHPGAFDNIKLFAIKSPVYMVGDLIFVEGDLTKLTPYYGAFDNMVGKIPTIAPPMPEGGSGGID